MAATGEPVRTLTGLAAPVWGVAFSPDSKRLAAAGGDFQSPRSGEVKVWDTSTGEEQLTLRHDHPATAVAFSADGKRLASAGADHTARVWDAADGRELGTCRGHTQEVWSVAFSPDGKRLATGSQDRTVRIWNSATGAEEFVFRGHSRLVGAVSFSPDGRRLASASEDRTVRLWDSVGGQECMGLEGHAAGIWGLAFNPAGTRLASVGGGGAVHIWDPRTGSSQAAWNGPGSIYAAAYSPDGKHLAVAVHDQTVRSTTRPTARNAACCAATPARFGRWPTGVTASCSLPLRTTTRSGSGTRPPVS